MSVAQCPAAPQWRQILLLLTARGNGKTALLRWFQRDIEAGENDIRAIWLTPSEIPGLNALAAELVPSGRFATLRPATLSFSIGIGPLDTDAAAAALTNPLAGLTPSITFTDTALERIVAKSQCYPYFLQLWGDALWNAANDARTTRIDDAVVAAAQPAFDLERTPIRTTG